MPMISLYFLLFMCAALCAVRAVNVFSASDAARIKRTKAVLLAMSYAFAAWADMRFVIVLGAMSISTWLCARKHWNTMGIVLAAASLVFFKYASPIAGMFAKLFGSSSAFELFFPLGISFYSFSAISYLSDVRRGKTQARTLVDVALYLSFFPRLTSGPIQKPADFFAQTDRPLAINGKNISSGMQIFCIGVFKKLVIADRTAVFADQIFSMPGAFDGSTLLLGVLAYTMQIYFDFSGYSDMAIGAARAIGIGLPKNFDLPYCAQNPSELWKRWHISLSSWLQEYIYIPLGGNRRGKKRTYINLLMTMMIGGLWHGAQAHYLVWGLWHGFGLVFHKAWAATIGKRHPKENPAVHMLSAAGTFLFTVVGWVFFRAENMADALLILKRIVMCADGIRHMHIWTFAALVLHALYIFAAMLRANGGARLCRSTLRRVEAFYPIADLETFRGRVLFLVFCGLIAGLAFISANPFIYGNF